jgi:hypothetical protein
MERVVLRKISCNKNKVGKIPAKTEFKTLITKPTIFEKENGEIIGGYFLLPEENISAMRSICHNTKISKTARVTTGLPTQSSVFGAVSRTALRQDYCRFTANTRNEKSNFEAVLQYAEVAASIHKKFFPQNYELAMQEAKNISGGWLMGSTPYATCNFNFNHAIKHHVDTGNIEEVFSNVLILRRGVLGGQLVLPDYGVALAQQDRAFTVFRGYSEVHGVMPIKAIEPEGYRASIVLYTLKTMKHCYPFQEEIERVRATRLEREKNFFKGQKEELAKALRKK